MSSLFAATAVAAMLVSATGAPQQAVPPSPPAAAVPPDPADLDEVLIEGRPARETAARFIDTIGAPTTSRRLARWPGAICVAVANLPKDTAQYLADRVSEVALELGLEPGEPGCTANVLIVVTVDAAGVATALVEEHRSAFRPGGSGMTRSLRELEDFKTSDRPVRWWHVSVPVDSETGERAVRMPGEDAPAINVSRASRLRTDIRDDLNKVIIVVDVDRLGATTFDQLADYVSMVALAQIDARASTSDIPTVLNVFEDPGSTSGLTSWDLAYLHALYRAEPNRSTVGGQAADIAGLMLQVRRDQEADVEGP